MRWAKLGRVSFPGRGSHPVRPAPYGLDDDTIRVYVSHFDEDDIARIGFVDVAADDPRQVVAVSDEPALDVGVIGAFDEHGVTPSAVIREGSQLRLYYSGWQRAVRVPGLSFTGVAVSADGGRTFERVSRAPILPRVHGERIRRADAAVVRVDGSWRALYLGADSWIERGGELAPKSALLSATSGDGLHWHGAGHVPVRAFQNGTLGVEHALVPLNDHGYSIWAIDSATVTARLGGSYSTGSATYLFYDGDEPGQNGFDVAALELGSG